MEKQSVKRESIIHVQNVFLTTPVNIFVNRETGKYIIGYEPKRYRIHYLLYKVDKRLINRTDNSIKFNQAVDISIREDFRQTIKRTDPKTDQLMKTVVLRIIPTRYTQLGSIYGVIFSFNWRRTNAGGLDEIKYEIPECPTIVNSNTIGNVCYKKVANQVSFGGTHGIHTYIVLAPQKGRYKIGEWIKMSNVSKSGRQYSYIDPITVSI
jgi:hypothetical protein